MNNYEIIEKIRGGLDNYRLFRYESNLQDIKQYCEDHSVLLETTTYADGSEDYKQEMKKLENDILNSDYRFGILVGILRKDFEVMIISKGANGEICHAFDLI